MSAHDAVQTPVRDPHRTGNRFGLTEALVAAERLLIKARHQPASLLATVGVPVAMVLIFGYIFGSAITVPGGADYREYLIPGLFDCVPPGALGGPLPQFRKDERCRNLAGGRFTFNKLTTDIHMYH